MNASSKRGNSPERWEKLLATLDEKLQLGLLEYLRRVNSYHFEDTELYIEPGDAKDQEYLCREVIIQQIKVFAEDSADVTNVKIKKLF